MRDDRIRHLLHASPATAIRLLYEDYYHKLKSIALRYTGDEESAADAVQEVFLSIWENAGRISREHEYSVLQYLVKAVRNRAISHYRQSAGTTMVSETFLDNTSADEMSVEGVIIREETIDEVRNLIATFPQKEKECLMMKLDEQLSTQQMAERLNVTVKAVERSLTSGRKRLKALWMVLNKNN